MERSKYFTVLIFLLLGFPNLQASHKAEVYKAYISDNMTLWKNTIDEMHLQKNKSDDFILELINYQYGYVAWCIGNDKDDLAEKYLELAEKNLSIIEKKLHKLHLVNAYKSAFYGFIIGLNIFQAPFIGPKSVDCAKLAIKLDKNDPYGYIQYANSEFYMPEAFGGSKKIALEYYKKAESLMEINKNGLENDWNYLSLLTIIAKAYTELENYAAAKMVYEKILRIEPQFKWVKNELYPEIVKKLK